MTATFRRRFLGVLLIMLALLLVRVFTSMAFVAGGVGYALSSGGGADPFQHLAASFTDGMRILTGTFSPALGRQRTLSVLDVPAQLEAKRKAIGTERLPGGSLIITVEPDRP